MNAILKKPASMRGFRVKEREVEVRMSWRLTEGKHSHLVNVAKKLLNSATKPPLKALLA